MKILDVAGRGTILTLAVIAATLGFAGSASAQAPYEPNDSFNTAFGPIDAGAPYSATFETQNDADYFYFYLPDLTQLRYQASAPAANDYGVSIEIYRQESDGTSYESDIYASAGETATEPSRSSGASTTSSQPTPPTPISATSTRSGSTLPESPRPTSPSSRSAPQRMDRWPPREPSSRGCGPSRIARSSGWKRRRASCGRPRTAPRGRSGDCA